MRLKRIKNKIKCSVNGKHSLATNLYHGDEAQSLTKMSALWVGGKVRLIPTEPKVIITEFQARNGDENHN